MAITEVFGRALAGELRLARGEVMGNEPGGRVRVRLGAGVGPEIACDVLRLGSDAVAPRLAPGQEVIVACEQESGRPGVILGVVGPVDRGIPSRTPQERPVATSGPTGAPLLLQSREIVVEAGEELTLRCGEASIKIRRDGKVIIRGEHILSRAKGTQRIKGGSVAIN